MNKLTVMLVLGIALLFTAGSAAAAPSKNEQNLEREAARLDRTAATPQGEQAVLARLSRDFRITGEQLGALRERGLGYGEIAIVLACARALTGGATDLNIERVLSLRLGPPVPGWGVVAKQLGIKLGPWVSQVRKVNNEARREMKKDHAPAVKKHTSDAGPPVPGVKHKNFSGEGKLIRRGRDAQ